MSKYTYYSHVRHPEYRLVMETGRPMPEGLSAGDWKAQEERPHDRVHKEVMKDIEKQGFGSYQQDIRAGDLPAN
jgi:hypothetical protein